MSTALILLTGWLASAAVVASLALKAGTFDAKEKAVSALVFAVLVVVGPAIVFGLAVRLLYQLCRGKGLLAMIRLDGDDAQTVPASRETMLCRLLSLRRRYDPELRRRAKPDHWPMFDLWRTPEADLLLAVEMFAWHRDAEAAIEFGDRRIERVGDMRWSMDDNEVQAAIDYVGKSLALKWRNYVELDRQLLSRAVRAALAWVLASIQRHREGSAYPPVDWWTERVSWGTAKQRCLGAAGGTPGPSLEEDTSRTAQDLRSLLSRAAESDDLFAFESPSETWQSLGGRSGLVLVRRGRPIGHVTLMMN